MYICDSCLDGDPTIVSSVEFRYVYRGNQMAGKGCRNARTLFLCFDAHLVVVVVVVVVVLVLVLVLVLVVVIVNALFPLPNLD